MLPNFKILCFVLGKKLLFVTALGSMTGCITAKHSPALVYRIKIEKGDNLRDIANRYKTTPEAIIDRNKLAKNAQLTPGQELLVRPEYKILAAKNPKQILASFSVPMKANLNWPAKGYLSSNFGYRWGRLHSGIDIAAPLGTTVYAAEGGKVIFAGWRKGYGRTVIIDHTHYRTLYAHLHRYNVRAGQFVTALQNIGAVGRSGNARGVHLHFEFRDSNDQPHNPIPFLPNNNYISMEDGTVRTGTM